MKNGDKFTFEGAWIGQKQTYTYDDTPLPPLWATDAHGTVVMSAIDQKAFSVRDLERAGWSCAPIGLLSRLPIAR